VPDTPAQPTPSLLSFAWSALSRACTNALQMLVTPHSSTSTTTPQQAHPADSQQAQGTTLEHTAQQEAVAQDAGSQVQAAAAPGFADQPIHAHLMSEAPPMWKACLQASPSPSPSQVSPVLQPQIELATEAGLSKSSRGHQVHQPTAGTRGDPQAAAAAASSSVAHARDPTATSPPPTLLGGVATQQEEARRQVLEGLENAMGQLSPLQQRRKSTKLYSLATSALQHQLAPDEADSLIYIQSRVAHKGRSPHVRPETVINLLTSRASQDTSQDRSQHTSRWLLQAMQGMHDAPSLSQSPAHQQQHQPLAELVAMQSRAEAVEAPQGNSQLAQLEQQIELLQVGCCWDPHDVTRACG
jgi:hypothetical protein